jgi:hypothetical protein
MEAEVNCSLTLSGPRLICYAARDRGFDPRLGRILFATDFLLRCPKTLGFLLSSFHIAPLPYTFNSYPFSLLQAPPTSCAHHFIATRSSFVPFLATSNTSDMVLVNHIDLDRRVTEAHRQARYERLQRQRRGGGRTNVLLDDAARDRLK